MSNPNLAEIAALIADPTRAEMLLAMMDGRSHPASDLAALAHVAPPTASHHLAMLVEAGLVRVSRQGRHRYHCLANAKVADLLETMGSIAKPHAVPRCSEGLREARTCYDHLAGRVAVQLRESLEREGAILLEGDRFIVTDHGVAVFAGLGIDIEELKKTKRVFAKACLDWTERVPHIGGALGAALLSAYLERGWVRRCEAQRRVLVCATLEW